MKAKILKVSMYVAGIICLYLFLAVRIKPMFNMVIEEKVMDGYWENVKYGELYYFSFIKHFREKLPHYSPDRKYRFTNRHPDLNEADILTFGDSFFDFSRMTTFPEELGKKTNSEVFYARMDLPLRYLKEHNYTGKEPKVLIYESTEYYLPVKFKEYHKDDYLPDNRSFPRKAVTSVRDFIFYENTETNYNIFLTRGYLTTGIYSNISTFKFDNFGYITKLTPEYSLKYDIPWLFYYEQISTPVLGFNYKHSEEEINTYCDRIADLSKQLKNIYNIQLVFLIIPSKYTACHQLINNNPYNNFIPRMHDGLKQRGIPYINIFDDFINSDEILYYGTDTHWNEKGQEIALEKTIEVINPLLGNNQQNMLETDN